MAKSNKEDFGGFGRYVDKNGHTRYYESNKSGGFGITPIKEEKFIKLLKEKKKQELKEVRRLNLAKNLAKGNEKKKALKEEERIHQERVKTAELAMAESEKLRAAAMKRKEEDGISSTQQTERQKHKIRLSKLHVSLSKDFAYVTEKYTEIFDEYSRLSQDKYYKVVSGRLLKLSVEYDGVASRINKLMNKVKRTLEFNIKFQDESNSILNHIEKLDIRFNTLMIDVDKTTQRVEKEKADKDKIAQEKRDKIAAKDQQKTIKRKAKTRERRLESVSVGRAKQRQERRETRLAAVAEGRERQEQVKEAKIEALQNRRKKVDNFFDMSRSPILAASKKVGGVAGGILGGIGSTLGLDFSEESKILSGLFSPVMGLGKLGLKGIKSLTQDSFGVHDEDMKTQIDSINNGKAKGKTSSSQSPKAKNKTSGIMSLKNGLGSISKSTSNAFSNTKNFFSGNVSNNKSNSKSNSTNSNSTANNNSNSQFKNTDFNRTDDNVDKELVEPITDLLDKILKEIKKGNDEKKKGMFGGVGKAGLYGAVAVGAVALGGHIKEQWKEMFSDNQTAKETVTNSNSNTKSVLIQKLKDKNASQEDVDRLDKLIDMEKDYEVGRGNPEGKRRYDAVIKERKEIVGKYLKNVNINNSNVAGDSKNSSSSSSSFRNVTNNVPIKSELTKIEKIKSEKEDSIGKLEDLKKYLSDVFIPKLADSIANSLVSKRGAGKSIMPPIDPF